MKGWNKREMGTEMAVKKNLRILLRKRAANP
jgi:hypothetical protein